MCLLQRARRVTSQQGAHRWVVAEIFLVSHCFLPASQEQGCLADCGVLSRHRDTPCLFTYCRHAVHVGQAVPAWHGVDQAGNLLSITCSRLIMLYVLVVQLQLFSQAFLQIGCSFCCTDVHYKANIPQYYRVHGAAHLHSQSMPLLYAVCTHTTHQSSSALA